MRLLQRLELQSNAPLIRCAIPNELIA